MRRTRSACCALAASGHAAAAALEKRKAADPYPYVVGTDSIRRYLQVAEECARVGALREK